MFVVWGWCWALAVLGDLRPAVCYFLQHWHLRTGRWTVGIGVRCRHCHEVSQDGLSFQSMLPCRDSFHYSLTTLKMNRANTRSTMSLGHGTYRAMNLSLL